ncbi:MAG: DinB family protein [Candidatus Eisenbacteria bacterium]
MSFTARDAVARQLGAAVTALENAIRACPPNVWGERIGPHEFWYLAFHTIFWLDCYATAEPETYSPPSPYSLTEMDPAGLYPERVYSPDELLAFLAGARANAGRELLALTPESAESRWKFHTYDLSRLEAFLNVTRHVQHHVGQLQLLLRQGGAQPPRWVRSSALPGEQA